MEVEGKRLDDDIVSELCQPCQKGNVSTQADGYCDDCEEYMCQTCVQSHLKMKSGNNHTFGTVADGRRRCAQSKEEKCKKPSRETIKYYCRDHDTVGCGDCIVAFHKKCETEFIRDLAKNIEESSDFKNILTEVDDLKRLKAEIEVSLGKNRNDNTEFHDKAIHGIQKSRAEIITWLDNATTKMEAEETEIWKENEIVLSKLDDWINLINDMIDKVRDDINFEKYTGENLFIRMIECKSKLSEFATTSVPEIKSNIDIKPFAFEANQNLCVFTKSANLGIIRLGSGTAELQIYQQERQSDVTRMEGANIVASNLPEHEAEVVGTGDTCSCKSPENPALVELEKDLEQRKPIYVEKKEKEILQESYDKLKQELVDKESLLSRERETYVLEIKEHEQRVVLLNQKVSSFYDLSTSLKSQLDSRNKKYELMESTYKAKQEQDNYKITSLQSELTKIRENHEIECKPLSSQIRDLQHQSESDKPTYQLPDPRAAGFDVGKRVQRTVEPRKGWPGTVAAVDPSGYIDMKSVLGLYFRCKAGAGGQYDVKLL